MNTAKLEIEWAEEDFRPGISRGLEIVIESGVAENHRHYTRPVSKVKTVLRCPHCDSVIYSRKSKWCGVCAEELPAGLLFSPVEAHTLERLIEFERLRHRRWMARISGDY